MTTEFWNDPRLSLTPPEIEALNLMPRTQADLLIAYMLGNGFYGMDFDHVPPQLEKLFSVYRRNYAKLSQNTRGISN